MSRVAIALSVFGLSLLAPSTAGATGSEFFGIAQGGQGGHTARHEVGDQKLQGLLQGGILERLPGVFLKTLSTEMLGTAARSCMACYVCGHGHTLRAQMPVRLWHCQR